MRTIDYDKQDKNTGNTENQIAVDEPIEKRYGNMQLAYEEGFAAEDGVRAGTAETSGSVKYPELSDSSHPDRTPDSIKKENPGLADN